MKNPSTPLVLLALVLLTGCRDERAGPTPPEVLAEREAAHRRSCAATALVDQAEDDIELLDASLDVIEPGPLAEVTRRATEAALTFSVAYAQHAYLRENAYALLDSATNHSATPLDSARYAQRAAGFSIRIPMDGTLEANVINSYQANLLNLLDDDDHPCNWDLPDFDRQR
jgi:hypothetical protein